MQGISSMLLGSIPEAPSHCPETRRRIRVAVCAWAYEMHDDPLISDAEFDALARSVDLSKATGRPDLDKWFRENFDPSTGMWVGFHPEPEGLERVYQMLRRPRVESAAPVPMLHLWVIAP